MILVVTVRDLLFVTWEVPPAQLSAVLPDDLEPELMGSTALITLSMARAVEGRLGRLPVPRFSKLTVHTYVTGAAGAGLCFLDSRVSWSALGRGLVGIPFQSTRIRARRGIAEAPALGTSVRYRPAGFAKPPQLESGPIGSHEIAYFESRSLFRFVARHSPISWEKADLLSSPRYGSLDALGLEVNAPCSVLYAERVSFRAELPPALVEGR